MSNELDFRVGQGLDAHAFVPGDHVMLCGVRIAHDRGIRAHSDGDAALHALCDALLGAAGLGDIGSHFPDHDPAFAGADSRELLRRVVAKVRAAGWRVNNADLTIVCEAPRLSGHVAAMRENLCADLEVQPGAASIKATTTEGMGWCGRGEGIAALAIVSLRSA